MQGGCSAVFAVSELARWDGAFLPWGSAPGPCPSEAAAPFGGTREINARPHSPITLLGGRGAALPDQLIPTHCGRSFPGTGKPALVCDQIPGITKPGCYTLLPSRCIAVRTPSRITPVSPPPLALFSRWDLLCWQRCSEGGSGAGLGRRIRAL